MTNRPAYLSNQRPAYRARRRRRRVLTPFGRGVVLFLAAVVAGVVTARLI